MKTAHVESEDPKPGKVHVDGRIRERPREEKL